MRKILPVVFLPAFLLIMSFPFKACLNEVLSPFHLSSFGELALVCAIKSILCIVLRLQNAFLWNILEFANKMRV